METEAPAEDGVFHSWLVLSGRQERDPPEPSVHLITGLLKGFVGVSESPDSR